MTDDDKFHGDKQNKVRWQKVTEQWWEKSSRNGVMGEDWGEERKLLWEATRTDVLPSKLLLHVFSSAGSTLLEMPENIII